ncbi:hypothetical protein HGRIS_001889 [Hohenbuehelia grisea]|uniref:Lectin n=1 Tax=Hohenbuehelia grisea TaxID=104357 RepID=A0ABR3JIY7_9AGAR
MRTPALTALPRLWLSPFVLLCLTRLSLASLVNVTVDDVFGDPESGSHIVYSSEAWNDGRNCSGCAAKPESSKVFQGTWTDSSFDGSRETVLQNATLGFSGTAVYVFCVVDILGSTDISFYIDGAAVGSFVQKAGESSQRYQYNTSVYANSSLPDGPHTLTIQNGRIGGGVVSILLDYVVYRYVSPDSMSEFAFDEPFQPFRRRFLVPYSRIYGIWPLERLLEHQPQQDHHRRMQCRRWPAYHRGLLAVLLFPPSSEKAAPRGG